MSLRMFGRMDFESPSPPDPPREDEPTSAPSTFPSYRPVSPSPSPLTENRLENDEQRWLLDHFSGAKVPKEMSPETLFENNQMMESLVARRKTATSLSGMSARQDQYDLQRAAKAAGLNWGEANEKFTELCTTYNDLCNQAARKIFYDQIGKDLNVNPDVWRSIIEQTYQGDFQQLAEKYWPILSNDKAVKLAIEDPSIWHFAARQYLRTRKLLAEYRQAIRLFRLAAQQARVNLESCNDTTHKIPARRISMSRLAPPRGSDSSRSSRRSTHSVQVQRGFPVLPVPTGVLAPSPVLAPSSVPAPSPVLAPSPLPRPESPKAKVKDKPEPTRKPGDKPKFGKLGEGAENPYPGD